MSLNLTHMSPIDLLYMCKFAFIIVISLKMTNSYDIHHKVKYNAIKYLVNNPSKQIQNYIIREKRQSIILFVLDMFFLSTFIFNLYSFFKFGDFRLIFDTASFNTSLIIAIDFVTFSLVFFAIYKNIQTYLTVDTDKDFHNYQTFENHLINKQQHHEPIEFNSPLSAFLYLVNLINNDSLIGFKNYKSLYINLNEVLNNKNDGTKKQFFDQFLTISNYYDFININSESIKKLPRIIDMFLSPNGNKQFVFLGNSSKFKTQLLLNIQYKDKANGLSDIPLQDFVEIWLNSINFAIKGKDQYPILNGKTPFVVGESTDFKENSYMLSICVLTEKDKTIGELIHYINLSHKHKTISKQVDFMPFI